MKVTPELHEALKRYASDRKQADGMTQASMSSVITEALRKMPGFEQTLKEVIKEKHIHDSQTETSREGSNQAK